jgi:hypothetical protein
MSNYLAVAGVTMTIMNTLAEAFSLDFPGAAVTSFPPDASGGAIPTVRANVFLYQIAHNPHWRNEDLPVRRASGDLAQRPVVALDLSYLMTFHGDESALEPQRLLGSAVHALDARPVLTPALITAAIQAYAATAGFASWVSALDLAEQIERVKLTPLPLSLEELSKLWSTLMQTPYRLSVTYQAIVVFIEGRDFPRPALPVRSRNLYVQPIRVPTLDVVLVEPAGGDPPGLVKPILPDSALLIRGERLHGASATTVVRIFGSDVDLSTLNAAQTVVTDTQIRMRLGDVVAAGAMPRAGAQGLQVIQTLKVGDPSAAHDVPLFESNAAPFVLHPTIGAATFADDSGQQIMTVPMTAVTIDPTQRVLAYLYPTAPPTPASPAAILPARHRALAADPITFIVDHTQVQAGTYLLSVQVDGAASLLDTDASGALIGPKVTIP